MTRPAFRSLLVAVLLAALVPVPAAATNATADLAGGIGPIHDRPGEPVQVYAWIENWPTDGATAAGPFDVEILVDGELLDAFRIEGMGAFGLQEYFSNETFSFPGGDHSFELRIDVHDEVAEADEDNTYVTVTRFGLEHPDLTTEIVAFRSEGSIDGRTLLVDWRVCNEGDLGSQVPVRIVGAVHARERVKALHPGEPYVVISEELDVLAPGDCREGTVSAPTGAVVARHEVRLVAIRPGGSAWEFDWDDNDASAWALVTPVTVVRV